MSAPEFNDGHTVCNALTRQTYRFYTWTKSVETPPAPPRQPADVETGNGDKEGKDKDQVIVDGMQSTHNEGKE